MSSEGERITPYNKRTKSAQKSLLLLLAKGLTFYVFFLTSASNDKRLAKSIRQDYQPLHGS